MARTFRQGPRFGSAADAAQLDPALTGLGEDVNPSAYLVNLADCMLVLACGFLVALLTAGSLQLGGLEELDRDDLAPVDVEGMDQAMGQGGEAYLNVGSVYLDPATGAYYLVEGSSEGAEASAESEGGL